MQPRRKTQGKGGDGDGNSIQTRCPPWGLRVEAIVAIVSYKLYLRPRKVTLQEILTDEQYTPVFKVC